MSLILRTSLAHNASAKRIMQEQYAEVNQMRIPSIADMQQLLQMTGNVAQTPAEAYREFDSMTKIDMVPAGETSTLTRLMQKAKPINIGKKVFEYRKTSRAGVAQTSLSGQIGVKLDNVDVAYAGTVVPVHDTGFGRDWRDIKAMQADGYDALVDDAREADRTLMLKMDDYLWNGDSSVVFKGQKWLGIKGDSTVATATIGLDLTATASTADNIRAEVARIRDILYITNNCTKPMRLGISREMASNWERPYSTADGNFGTIGDYVGRLRGISEIYEDSRLSGNEFVLYWDDMNGFHPVVGMGVNTYAVPRQYHNSDFNFIKWAAVGFLAKTDFSSRKCVLYAS
jgi:hypothetical protein